MLVLRLKCGMSVYSSTSALTFNCVKSTNDHTTVTLVLSPFAYLIASSRELNGLKRSLSSWKVCKSHLCSTFH